MAAVFELNGVIVDGPFFDLAPTRDGASSTPVVNFKVEVTEVCDDGRLRKYSYPLTVWDSTLIDICADLDAGQHVWVSGVVRGRKFYYYEGDGDEAEERVYAHAVLVARRIGLVPFAD